LDSVNLDHRHLRARTAGLTIRRCMKLFQGWQRALAILIGGTIALNVANAAAPQIKTQAPGYYRIMPGEFEVTVLNDGTLSLPASVMTNTTEAETEKALARNFQKSPFDASDNAFLINTGAKLVLIDTGCGSLLGPTAGNLLTNLKAAGYRPEQIDEVYLTHMHADHAGGDLVRVAAVQFREPSVTIQFDVDSQSASMQRRHALADAAKAGYLVGTAHLSFPGIGHVRAEGKSYAWVPVIYSALK
jgi:beta-lactamase superfamily II metal-dependent hydrolase